MGKKREERERDKEREIETKRERERDKEREIPCSVILQPTFKCIYVTEYNALPY
jgi:hypothetical protein